MHHDPARREAIARRFARIAGQVGGIERMVREDRYCIDVLIQIAAARAALARAEGEVLRDHARGCVQDAIAAGDPATTKLKLDEIVHLFERAR